MARRSFKMSSNMKHSFSQSPQATIPRSVFDRTSDLKTTFDSGYLIPIFVDEALPGDTFKLEMTAFGRLATPLFPFMDNLYLETFFFAVPNRLLWENWERFCGAQDNPGDSTDYLVPTMTSPEGGYGFQTLHDYIGIPPSVANLEHNVWWHRAYNFIWNEFFRDENLQNSVPFSKDDGPDDPADYVLLRRGKRYDYFTSALPWPQKGPAVELPLGQTAPVVPVDPFLSAPTFQTNFSGGSGSTLSARGSGVISNPSQVFSTTGLAADSTYEVLEWLDPQLMTDLSSATAATVNQLRQAFQIQKLLERDARGGSRYVEMLLSHFGVTSPDFRLQRPEYLGGGRAPVSVAPVPQTSSTDGTSPQGNLAAFGTFVARNHGFVKSFVEHSVIIGLACVRADLSYQQGLDRMFSRQTRWDYYWPALAHIGEQAILRKEIFAIGNNPDNQVWGYQERWAEYRYKNSRICGLFRSSAPQSLDSWHLAQDFSVPPTLSAAFIQEDPPVDRVKALGDDYPDFISDFRFTLRCARPMPTYSVPGYIDHF